jgi:hypothetical protein
MRTIYLFMIVLLGTIPGLSQPKTSVKWGEDFKIRKYSAGLKVISSDKTGVYLMESHMAIGAFYVVVAKLRESATLVKLDGNLADVYRHDYNDELKGKEFEQFFSCGDNLYIFASAFIRRDENPDLYAAKIDKASGDLIGGWQMITPFEKSDRKDEVLFKVTYNADSTKMVVVCSMKGKEKNQYKILELDKNLKVTEEATFSNEFEPKEYQLEDVLYTVDKKVLLVGRIYAYEEGKKKKEKFLDFDHYSIRLYDRTGKQEAEINTDINGKYLTSTRLLQGNNKGLVLAAFYSNVKKSGNVDGLLVQRIDINSGKAISTNEKEIGSAMLSADEELTMDDDKDEEEDDKPAKRKRIDKTDVEGEGITKNMKFRNMFFTSDGGVIILAEPSRSRISTSTMYNPGNSHSPGSTSTFSTTVFESGDMMMCKIAATGDIAWLKTLPKKQRERYTSGSTHTGPGVSFFSSPGGASYSGFGAMQLGSNIDVFMNDNPKNLSVTTSGQQVRLGNNLHRSDCFLISIDEVTGNITRKQVFSNREIPTAMPASGVTIGRDMYIVGKTYTSFSKPRIAVGKITVK